MCSSLVWPLRAACMSHAASLENGGENGDAKAVQLRPNLVHANLSVRSVLSLRVVSLLLNILNAHSQAVFVAADPSTPDKALFDASIATMLLLAAADVLFVYRYADALAMQLGPFGVRGSAFYVFLLLSVCTDLAGFALTLVLGVRLQYDRYQFVSVRERCISSIKHFSHASKRQNLLPSTLSVANTLVNAYI